jgi:starvation-inducible DNA-binding protein
MTTLDYIKLDAAKTAKTVAGLQQLLADYQVFYANLRGYHWNVKGCAFFALHGKLEEWYDDAADKVDEVAERILTLGGVPENRPSEYAKTAGISSVGAVSDSNTIVANVLGDIGKLIAREREVQTLASQAGDEGTSALMSDYIRAQEKTVWMLVATLSK